MPEPGAFEEGDFSYRRRQVTALARTRRRWKELSDTRRDLSLGVGAALAAVAALLIELSQWHFTPEKSLVLGIAATALSGAAVVFRRRLPLVAGLITASMASFAGAIEYWAFFPSLISAVIVGACAAQASRRLTVVLGAGVILIALGFEIYETTFLFHESLLASSMLSTVALAAIPVAIGDAFRVRRELTAEAVARAARLEQLRELELERAVDEERLRIARDVHDTVGHHLSAIAIQAGAGEQLAEDADADGAMASLRTIRGLTGTALGETRRLLGLVRAGAERRPPGLAGVSEIESLARDSEGAGLSIAVERVGEERPLAGVVGDCAYRIVQEALTNVTRHAGASHASVELRYGPATLELLIVDDGTGGEPDLSGHGLIGMRERVAMVHGELSTGPVAGGGWRVRATLPYEPAIVR